MDAIPDTQSLLERARGGDTEAFCDLCRMHETALLRQAFVLCGNATLAEDLAQDTLVEAWKSLRRYNGRCRLLTWLCAILLNRYRNTLREKRPMPFTSLADPEGSELEDPVERLADPRAWPDEAAAARDQAALMRKCVASLPPKHQQAIYLRFFVDDSIEGIAAAMGCSVGTVKSRLFNALEKLRAMKDLSRPVAELETKVSDQ